MVTPQLMERVVAAVTSHVRASKGDEEESFINPLTPVDSAVAFAMAKMLTEQNAFDVGVPVAPEGHIEWRSEIFMAVTWHCQRFWTGLG